MKKIITKLLVGLNYCLIGSGILTCCFSIIGGAINLLTTSEARNLAFLSLIILGSSYCIDKLMHKKIG